MPTVSVTMPSHNHAKFVGIAIDSVLRQDFSDWELIIVDDASTDGTQDEISKFKDPRIKFFRNADNIGGTATLNKCIRLSEGKFVCYLASDDLFHSEKLTRQLAYFRENSRLGALFGIPQLISESGQLLPDGKLFRIPFDPALQTRQKWLRHLFYHGNCLAHPTAMVRREVFDTVGFFNSRLWGLPDFEFWLRICSCFELRAVPWRFSAFRILNGNRNISAPRKDSMLRDQFEFYQSIRCLLDFPRELLVETFSDDILRTNRDVSRMTSQKIVAEASLLGKRSAHKFLALDLLFNLLPEDRSDRRFVDLTGEVDVFNVLNTR